MDEQNADRAAEAGSSAPCSEEMEQGRDLVATVLDLETKQVKKSTWADELAYWRS